MSFPLDYTVLKNDILWNDSKLIVDHAQIHNDIANSVMGLEQYLWKDWEANFYTKSEIDNALQAADDASEINFNNTASWITETKVQWAIDKSFTKISDLETTVWNLDVYSKSETDQKITDLVNSAPAALDTLKELSDALWWDENFATTITTSIATKAKADWTTVFPSILLADWADTYKLEVENWSLQAVKQ